MPHCLARVSHLCEEAAAHPRTVEELGQQLCCSHSVGKLPDLRLVLQRLWQVKERKKPQDMWPTLGMSHHGEALQV